MTDNLDLDAIEAREKVMYGLMDDARLLELACEVASDVPALVTRVRQLEAAPVVSRAELAAAIEDYIEPVWGAADAAVAAIVVVLEAAGVAVTDKPEADLTETA